MRNENDDQVNRADRSAVTDMPVMAKLGVVPQVCTAPPGAVMPGPIPHYLPESA